MDDRSLKGWAKIILKDRYGKEVKQDMTKLKRTKLRKKPIDATWEELGMKPGVRVPGTASWMAEWKRCPNQKGMISYAKEVQQLVETMSEMGIGIYLKKYLTGDWSSAEEAKIAAAIRRSPVWEAKFNQMEESLMSKKQADVVKKAGKKAEGASLKDRIETLEEEVEALKEAMSKMMPKTLAEAKKEKKGKADTPAKANKAAAATEDVKDLLEVLKAAKEAGDKQTAFKTRAKLRKAGYSLRANGKK